MKIKALYISLFLLFVAQSMLAQTNENDDSYVQSDDDEYVLSKDSVPTTSKVHYNFEMGVGIGSGYGGGSNFNTYYKPSISYQATDKLTINAGVMYVNSQLSNSRLYGENNYQFFSGNISEYYTYINAQYQLTDRLSVGGSVSYNMTTYNSDFSNTNLSHRSNMDHIGYSANFKYKISNSMSIQGEIRVGDRYSPFNQYQNNGFNSSFGNTFSTDPFRTW
jgi:hypothetical protein